MYSILWRGLGGNAIIYEIFLWFWRLFPGPYNGAKFLNLFHLL